MQTTFWKYQGDDSFFKNKEHLGLQMIAAIYYFKRRRHVGDNKHQTMYSRPRINQYNEDD